MRFHTAFLDLLATMLMLFIASAMLTARNNSEEQHTPPITLPRAAGPFDAGSGGVSGAVTISAQQAVGGIEFLLDDTALPRPALEAALRQLAPPKAVLRVDAALPSAVLVQLVVMATEAGIPATIAYKTHPTPAPGDSG